MDLLILHAGALGDCVLTIHVAMALRTAGHRLTLAARSAIAPWSADHGLIDEAIPLERFAPVLWPGTSATSPPDDAQKTSPFARFDRVISFLGGPDEAITWQLIKLRGDGEVIAVDSKPTLETLQTGRHITEQWASEIRRAGIEIQYEISNPEFEISDFKCEIQDTSKAASRWGRNSPRPISESSVLIHPGSGGRDKCCPIEALEALIHDLIGKGGNARWIIGPDEMERDGPEFGRRLERSASVVFEESVGKAADLIAGADAYIGNDAGMTHVAALAGVYTIALFGPTDPRIWQPLGPRCTTTPFPENLALNDWVRQVTNRMRPDRLTADRRRPERAPD